MHPNLLTTNANAVNYERANIVVSPLRQQISQELHNRPSPQVNVPTSITHLAVRITEQERDLEYQQIYTLCQRYNVNPPTCEASCYYQDFGGFELRWERHLEFSSYSFIRKGLGKSLFDGYATEFLPQEWFDNIIGELVSAVNLVMHEAEISEQALYHAFEGHQVLGSNVAGDRANV
ncbi:MAG: putative membrane-anchored protein, partial [Cognaticolwellia sp.]